MVLNNNRSDQKKGKDRRSIKRQHTKHQKLRKKPKTGKNHGVARKSTIIKRLQGDKEEDLTAAFYNSFRFSPHTLITLHFLL